MIIIVSSEAPPFAVGSGSREFLCRAQGRGGGGGAGRGSWAAAAGGPGRGRRRSADALLKRAQPRGVYSRRATSLGRWKGGAERGEEGGGGGQTLARPTFSSFLGLRNPYYTISAPEWNPITPRPPPVTHRRFGCKGSVSLYDCLC